MAKDNFLDLNFQESRLLEQADSFPSSGKERISKALLVSRREHEGQTRHSGESYVIHPIRAALILLEELEIRDADSVCALLLHDVIEDGSLSYQGVREAFGPQVERLVKGLTRERPENETEEQKRENKLKHIKELSQESREIQLLKLCDVLDNARSWKYIPESNPNFEKIPRWKNELKNYLPLAKKVNSKLFLMLQKYIRVGKESFPQ
ncbi:MAG: HD domain-containing protein [Candidatus Nealsonbacteria bacterium]|nr:HD domain-containing protein [Candidatus Nealsonbacteria bacterium]